MSTRNRIKELRKEKGLSQKEFAKAFNEFSKDNENIKSISYATVSRWENGENEPKLETWIKLADFFDVPVAYLQGISDNKELFEYKDFIEASDNIKHVKSGRTIKINNLKIDIADENKIRRHFLEKVVPNIVSDDNIRFFLQTYVQIKNDKSFSGSYKKLIALLNGLVLYTSDNYSKEAVSSDLNDFLYTFKEENHREGKWLLIKRFFRVEDLSRMFL